MIRKGVARERIGRTVLGRKTIAPVLAVLFSLSVLPAADLPVRKVTLYKDGIGFFERAGRVPAGETARLEFTADQMNDILKSLTIEERGGGRVIGVRYDSSEPLARKLQEFPFAISSGQAVPAILDQMKGARVELHFGSAGGAERVQGIIVSARSAAASERQAEKQELILLLDSGDLRAVDLLAASGIRFMDPKLQAQFQEYLIALGQSRNRDKRGLLIESSAAGPRDLIADYIIPAPAWKTSYRLIFDSNAEPMLEGWAIVDNLTGEDWTNISLSLVSGLPVSFVTRLYEPRYVARPEAELPGDRAQRPILHAAAMEELQSAANRAAAAPVLRGAPAVQAGVGGGVVGGWPDREFRKERDAKPLERAEFASSLAQTAGGRELGDLFEYRIGHPVTVRKEESAMLPFLQQRIKAERLLVYSESYGSQHPLAAVQITNSTGTTLDGGAITVIDAGAYAGESLMETLKAGDKRLVSYAVDLGARVTTAFDSQSQLLREFHFRRGVLTTRTAIQETKTFTVRNVDSRSKTLLIETPVRPEFKLLDIQPLETTPNAHRFALKLGPNTTQRFPVREERVIENSIAISSLTPDVLMTYVQNRNLEDASRKKLEPLLTLKQQLASAQAEAQRVEKEIQDLFQDQQRLRQNIDSLNRVNGQQQRVQEYAQRLASQESQLAGLRDRQSELQRRRASLEQQISKLVDALEF
ncbi:MAG TPA: hypothetical protein VFA54_16355 [Bryobacterales bacterium]|nr:hypothetical protein [Bryobacterales bacterium]